MRIFTAENAENTEERVVHLIAKQRFLKLIFAIFVFFAVKSNQGIATIK